MSLYPLLLSPALHTRVWGGRRLETVFHKPLPSASPYGEAWEMHDTATIINGALAGRTVADALREYGHALVGPDSDPALGVPLLVKFLDAADWLSIQVHPNDEQARRLDGEPRGKTEAWYVLAAEPGARLVMGVQPGTSPDEMAEAIRTNMLEERVVYADVAAGDVLYIAAGTVHALGPGLLIYEIQQSSDLTYRLYDWGRLGLDGKPRALHIEKGVAVSNLDALPQIRHTAGDGRPIVEIVNSEFFTTWLHQLNPRNGPRITLDTENRCFHILTCVEGAATVAAGDTSFTMQPGQTALVPANQGEYLLSGTARVLRSFQGE